MGPPEDIITEARNVLQTQFGLKDFRPGQESVIKRLLSPVRSQARAIAIFPTGGGKSLCYQLPALLYPTGLTLVVSPLLALMKDQVDSLKGKGIPAAALDSTLTGKETREVFNDVRSGAIKILYVSPERLKNDRFARLVSEIEVALFAVDEAHCMSQWGHSFRPNYLRLSHFADEFGFERRLALTATATPDVAIDIANCLSIPYPQGMTRLSSVRPNLDMRFLSVPSTFKGRFAAIDEALAPRVDALTQRLRERPPGPTIVYVTLQATATQVATMLQRRGFLNVRPYHAGMPNDERVRVQNWFLEDTRDAIVVATIAFGMGIDKPDIRYVYHFNISKSLDTYVQEIGRAGRDGKHSICETLACIDDAPVLAGFAYGSTPSLEAVQDLMKELFEGKLEGELLQFSKYQLIQTCDMRDTTFDQILVQLDLDEGLIKETTHFYSTYTLRKLPESPHLSVPKNSSLGKILAIAKQGPKLVTFDTVKSAELLGLTDVNNVSGILIDAVQDGFFEDGDKKGVMNQAVLLKVPDDLGELTKRIYKRVKNQEQREIDRLEEILAFSSAKECQVRRLARRFGDDVGDMDICNHCEFCLNDCSQPVTIDAEQRARLAAAVDEARWADVTREDGLPKDNPLLIARFAAGITSPVITRLRLKKLKSYGSMADHDFHALLRKAKNLCGSL